MPDNEQPTAGGWLLLVYRVPPEPSGLRAAVWRRLKSLGVIYLQNRRLPCPRGLGAERARASCAARSSTWAARPCWLSCSVLAGPRTCAAFQAARDDEYEEIVDRCEDFLAQVKKEHVAHHYTYAELEENEVDLDKLQKWFARVRQRDVFGAGGRQAAEKALALCAESLEEYAARVYAEEADGH